MEGLYGCSCELCSQQRKCSVGEWRCHGRGRGRVNIDDWSLEQLMVELCCKSYFVGLTMYMIRVLLFDFSLSAEEDKLRKQLNLVSCLTSTVNTAIISSSRKVSFQPSPSSLHYPGNAQTSVFQALMSRIVVHFNTIQWSQENASIVYKESEKMSPIKSCRQQSMSRACRLYRSSKARMLK